MPSAPVALERASIRLAEISVNQAAFDEKIVGIFRFDTDARGKRGPTLVLLAEIASSLYVYEQLLDALCAAAERTRQLMTAVDTDPMTRFEKMTQQLNEAVANFVKAEPTPLSWNRINIFALEISDQGICLTGIGRMTNLFLQKQADGSYRTFDLFGSLEQPTEVNPQKPFASFICGDFHPGDLFFAGSGNFERLRQELELKEKLINYPPVTAALEIKQELEHRRIPDHFSGLIVANVLSSAETAPAQQEETEKPVDAAQSVQDLHEEQLETEAYVEAMTSPLSSSGSAALKAWKTKLTDLHTDLVERFRTPAKSAGFKPAARVSTDDPLTLASLRGMSSGHGGGPSAKTKTRLIVSGLVVLLLVGGGVWIQRARTASAEQTLWNAVYTNAIDKRNRADADLLYQNDARAKTLVQEAFALVEGLDTKTTERKETKESILRDLEGLRQRLRKEQRVDEPVVVYQASDATLGELILTDTGLAAIQTKEGATSIIPLSNNVAGDAIPVPSEGSPVIDVALTRSGILGINEQKQLTLTSLTRKTSGIVALNAPSAGSSNAINIYNARLYMVDAGMRMIWRYNAAGTGFGQETKYLKAPAEDLSQAKSIAIDSHVYVGLRDGRILKFLSGDPQPWDNNQTDPALSEVTKLWTDLEGDRIVALDAKSKRIAIYTKNGTLVSQIVSQRLTEPTGLAVDAATKKIFVTNGPQLLQFDLP